MAFALQQTTGAAATSPSHSQTAGFAIVGLGNLLVVIGDAVSSATIADSLGHTWTTVVSLGRITIWATIVTTAGPIVVTVTSSQSALISLSLREWSFAGGAVGVASTATGSGTSTTPATSNLTLTATSLVEAGFDVVTSGLTYTPSSGFTAGFTTNSGSSEPFATEYNAAQSTTPVAPGFTLSSSSAWTGAAAAFSEIDLFGLIATEARDTASSLADFASPAAFALTEAHDALASAGATTAPAALAATGGADTSGLIAAATMSAILTRTEGGDLPSIVGDTPRSAALTTTAGSDALAGVGTCIVATLAPTGGPDVLAMAGAMMSVPVLAATEGADTSGLAGVATTSGTIGATAGSDAFSGAGDQFIHVLGVLTEARDTLAASGFHGPPGGLVGTEAGDSAAIAGVFTTSGVMAVTPAGDDQFSQGSNISYRVYANGGSGPINYDTPIATTGQLTYTTGILACSSTWQFGVRAFDSLSGLEEQNLDCSVTIVLDAGCVDITARPAAPTGLRAFPIAGGSVKVEWHFPPAFGIKAPTGFHVFKGTGGVVDYTTVVSTVLFTTGLANSFQATLAGLTDGVQYVIGVRSYNSSAEEPNVAFATVTADATGPSPVTSLTGSAIV